MSNDKLNETNETKRKLAAELEADIVQEPGPDAPPEPQPETEKPKRARRTKKAAISKDPEPATVLQEPEPDRTAGSTGIVLLCDHCSAELLPDKSGMYPEFCPACHAENDYRGIAFLEQSEDILVCDRCGHLTKLNPGVDKCHWCGAGGA